MNLYLTLHHHSEGFYLSTKFIISHNFVPRRIGMIARKFANVSNIQAAVGFILEYQPKLLLGNSQLSSWCLSERNDLCHASSPPGRLAISGSFLHCPDGRRY